MSSKKRSKAPKRHSRHRGRRRAKKLENKWSHVLGGLSGTGNNLIHQYLTPEELINLMDSSKKQKDYVLETSRVSKKQHDAIDDARFRTAWNKAGIQDYYYSVPLVNRQQSSVNLDGMFVISKNEVDGLDPRKTYVPGEASGRSWEWKIGLINNLDLGYKVNDFKEFYDDNYLQRFPGLRHTFDIYEFPFNPPGKNDILDIIDGVPPITVKDVAVELDEDNVPMGINEISTYAHILRERYPNIVSADPTPLNNVELTKAYMAECKIWFSSIFLNTSIKKIFVGKKSGWEKFKENIQASYNYLCGTSSGPTAPDCVLMGGKKKRKRKTKRKRKGGSKKKKSRRKKKTRKKRKK